MKQKHHEQKPHPFLARLKEPGLPLLCLIWFITLLSIAGSLAVVFMDYTGFLSYPLYVVAAMTLTYTVYSLVRVVPTMKSRFLTVMGKRDFTRNLTEDYSFRTVAFSCISFVINIGFVIFNSVFAITLHSVWYGAMAGYYLLLSAIRGSVVLGGRKAVRKARGDETALLVNKLKVYRNCGVSLFILEVAMAVAVSLMVLSRRPTQSTEIMAIASAAYTFVKMTASIVNLVKAKRIKDPVVQSIRNIGLAEATVSMLSLCTVLIATFGKEDTDMFAMKAVAGMVVCLMTVLLGAFMIVYGNIQLKKAQAEQGGRNIAWNTGIKTGTETIIHSDTPTSHPQRRSAGR